MSKIEKVILKCINNETVSYFHKIVNNKGGVREISYVQDKIQAKYITKSSAKRVERITKDFVIKYMLKMKFEMDDPQNASIKIPVLSWKSKN